MATVLVVDDSAADQRLIAHLLEQDTELTAIFASDGREALDLMEEQKPDLVLTDLRMPRMDGLELVANLRRDYPLVPVILMTSRGSEDIAVQSLRQGASSYVPKRALSQDLVRTIRSLLELSGARRGRSRVLQSMQEVKAVYLLENDFGLLSDLVNHLEDQLKQMGFGDDGDCIRVSVALTEALSNALYHGNLEMDSALRETDFEAYLELARKRSREKPFSQRRIRLETNLSREKAVFAVEDEGRGFDPDSLPDPTITPNLEKVTGRGIMLMHTLMDQVKFNRAGNRVQMVKRGVRAQTRRPRRPGGGAGSES